MQYCALIPGELNHCWAYMNWMGFTVRTLRILQFSFRCLKVLFIKLLLKLQLKPPIQGLWKLRWYHTFGQNLSNILGCHYCGFETCWKPQLSCVKGSLKRVWNFQNSFLREGNDQSLNGRALSLLIHCSQSSKREKILVFARDAASIGHLENCDLSSFLWQGKIIQEIFETNKRDIWIWVTAAFVTAYSLRIIGWNTNAGTSWANNEMFSL